MKNPSPASIKKNATAVLRKFGVKRVFLFGSVARGQARTKSDIDLLVDFKKTPSLSTVVALERELSEKLGRSIDILTRGQLTDRLNQRITPDLKKVL